MVIHRFLKQTDTPSEDEAVTATAPEPETEPKSKSTKSATCIPRSLFEKAFHATQTPNSRWRVRKNAIWAIQKRAEQHVAHLFRIAAANVQNNGRTTITANDFAEAAKQT